MMVSPPAGPAVRVACLLSLLGLLDLQDNPLKLVLHFFDVSRLVRYFALEVSLKSFKAGDFLVDKLDTFAHV